MVQELSISPSCRYLSSHQSEFSDSWRPILELPPVICNYRSIDYNRLRRKSITNDARCPPETCYWCHVYYHRVYCRPNTVAVICIELVINDHLTVRCFVCLLRNFSRFLGRVSTAERVSRVLSITIHIRQSLFMLLWTIFYQVDFLNVLPT